MRDYVPPRLSLAQTPTPVHKLARLSELLGGPEIWIKRDDLTGCAASGNKVRKLEFVLADALRQGAQVIVTCGGIQSNHARATAVLARQLGLHPHLLLRGEPPADTPDGNFFLDLLAGATVTFVSPDDYRHRLDELFAEVRRQYETQGKRAYVIPEGASNELGAFGYLRATREIVEQLRLEGIRVNYVVTAVGSGGTLAGLLLGKRLYSLEAEVLGINVCETADYFHERILGIVRTVADRYHLGLGITPEDVKIIDGYVGRGYAESRPEELDLIRDLARLEGIILDPVYTGKAMFGLLDQIRRGRFAKSDRILFLHTGGIFGLFAKRKEMNLAVEGAPSLGWKEPVSS
ncbi:MAG: D-cysteine desulfhydrase family protein [candidate division KSB1 bacterium]|nr:D-cysteine desulfhydrase family protein [candidate division KSB1 bacterium]